MQREVRTRRCASLMVQGLEMIARLAARPRFTMPQPFVRSEDGGRRRTFPWSKTTVAQFHSFF